LACDQLRLLAHAAAQVAAICQADDSDLAFIDLTIPHHRMAIESSRIILEQTDRPQLHDFERRVIAAQDREIAELTGIRQDLAASATPANP
jgi:uncharacterized protein (DUF305 family)